MEEGVDRGDEGHLQIDVISPEFSYHLPSNISFVSHPSATCVRIWMAQRNPPQILKTSCDIRYGLPMSFTCTATGSESMSMRSFTRSAISQLSWGLVVAIISLPVSPSIYALMVYGHQCANIIEPGSDSAFLCLVNLAATAPLLAITGSLADDGADTKMWFGIVLVSLAIGISFSVIGAWRPSARRTGR